MLRIALNGRFYGAPVTGVQRVAREIAARLYHRARVTLFLPRGVTAPTSAGSKAPVVRGALPARVWEQIELPLRLRRSGCDVVLHLGQSAPAVGGGPSVVMVYDLTPLTHAEWYRPAFRWWFRAALARPARRATRLLVLSQWTKSELVRVLGVDPDRVDLVSQGVAPFDAPAEPAAVDGVRAKWALPAQYLLTTGGGDRRKNVEFLLDVLRRWPGGNPPALVVTGSPHRQLHADGALPPHGDLRVHLLGRVTDDELRALYTGAAAFCFPSLAEGFGRPPLEAMGCGAPVVAADYATAAEVLGDAAIILPLTPARWAETLARLLSDSAERARLTERGRRRAALCDWDRATDQVLASCEKALTAAGGAPGQVREGWGAPRARVSGARALDLASSAARAQLQRAAGAPQPQRPEYQESKKPQRAAGAARPQRPAPAAVAIVHDWLVRMRGGERCLEALLGVFPDADVFTLLHVPGAVSPAIERRLKATSFVSSLPAVRHWYPYCLPLFPRAIERFDLGGYDLVISVSHCVAKGARTAGVPHLCYCLTPMRYVWDMYQAYFGDGRATRPTGRAMKLLAPGLRRWDVESAARADRFVAISAHVRDRIARIYGRPSDVVYPPVAVERFSPAPRREDFYLSVSALVPYKRLDVAVDAFTRLGRPLVIVGEGSEYRRLTARAGPNVRFTGWIPDAEVADLMGRCRAFMYPAEEDFGIALVEAQAAGAPVIAYGAGGALETVDAATGLFFYQQTSEALVEAVRRFESMTFDPAAGPVNAARFSMEAFQAGIRQQVEQLAGGGLADHRAKKGHGAQ